MSDLNSVMTSLRYLAKRIRHLEASSRSSAGVTDHTLLTNIGTTSHADIDIALSGLSTLPSYLITGRLTYATGDPEATADQATKTTLYYTPYIGDKVPLYSSGSWIYKSFSELSLDISGYTASKPYDIFVYDNSGTVTLYSVVWTNITTRATSLTRQNGLLVLNGSPQYLYLGTLYMDASSKGNDTKLDRSLYNQYNKILKPVMSTGRTSGLKIYFVCGNPSGQYMQFGVGGSIGRYTMMYMYSTNVPSGAPGYGEAGQNQNSWDYLVGTSQGISDLFNTGYNYIEWAKGGTGGVTRGWLIGQWWC